VVHVLTHATALAELVRDRAFSAVMFTPFILPFVAGTSLLTYPVVPTTMSPPHVISLMIDKDDMSYHRL
jgi:hypothetical protein